TNFIYKVNNLNLSVAEIEEINAIDTRSKIKDRIEELKKLKGKFQFKNPESSVFENNLVLIDSALPRIISEILLLFFTSNFSTSAVLVSEISKVNTLSNDLINTHPWSS